MKAHSQFLHLSKMLKPAGFSLAVILLTGCPASNQTPNLPKRTDTEKVIIKGSNTVGEELAPRLIAEYKKDHPQAAFELETKGSASGFWGLIAGVSDIAASSRGMIEDEQRQAQVHGVELNDHVIGSYSVAIIVNAASPVKELSRDQVRDIFTGTVQNWKDVGGPDAPIHLYARDPISGTYLGFRELALGDKAYATNLSVFTSYGAIVEAVGKDANGIGYSSIQQVQKPGIKPVSIGGVAASAAAVKEGKYPYFRVLHLYTNKTKETAPTRDFIAFIESPKGQQIVDQMGYVTKP